MRNGPIKSAYDIPWNKVAQIDVARVATLVVENFIITLRLDNDVAIQISDVDPQFEEFRTELVRNWPQLEQSLAKIYCSPPDIEERATLWKQQASY
ncbi:MAG TPA: hypothetical protein VN935_00840 [Rhizomicrobium sp.]|jgi:hypothetical protein|nr:hypothetical protein [Rhizomicrobium sp.]